MAGRLNVDKNDTRVAGGRYHNFKDLMKELEKNFGIRIIIDNHTLDNYACSGKFRISDGIEQVLRALQQDAHFTFERESGTEIRIQ